MKFYKFIKNDENQTFFAALIEKYLALFNARHQECNEYEKKMGTPSYTVSAALALRRVAEETKEVIKELRALEELINQQTPRIMSLEKKDKLTHMFQKMNDPELMNFLKEKFRLVRTKSNIDTTPNKIKFSECSGGRKSESLLKCVLQHSTQKLFPYFNLTLARALENAQFMPKSTAMPSIALNEENTTPVKMRS